MIETILKLVACHLIGDYVLQCDYIAKSKGDNWYHLFVHCFLYAVPFYICFGFDWRLIVIFVSHILVDALKSRFKAINYTVDQILHYIVLLVYLIP